MLSIVISESKEVNLLGDINVDFLKANNNKDIKEVFNLYGLKQIITKATRVTETSKTLIDCILTSRTDSTYVNDVIPTSISDHDMVGFVRKIKRDKLPPKNVKSRNYAKYNSDNMNVELRHHDWSPMYEMKNVN